MAQAINDLLTVSFLSLHTCPDGTQPVFVCVFFVCYQLNSCCAMEVKHRTHYCIDVTKHVHKTSFRKELTQATDVKRILGRAIDPTSVGPGSHACGFEPLEVNP